MIQTWFKSGQKSSIKFMISIKPKIIRGNAAIFSLLLNYLHIFGERWQTYQYLSKCTFTNFQIKLLQLLRRRIFGIFHWQCDSMIPPSLSHFMKLFKVSSWPHSSLPKPFLYSTKISEHLSCDGSFYWHRHSGGRRKQTKL